MSVQRKQIGEPETYRGHLITVHYMGPDLLVRVDDAELPSFYIDAEAARKAGRRHADALDKAKDEAA